MNIYLLSLLILPILSEKDVVSPQVPAGEPAEEEPPPKYSITKGRFKTSKAHGSRSLNNKYPPFDLCTLGPHNLALRAKVVSLNVRNNNKLSLIVQMFKRTMEQKKETLSLLASYEVEKSDTSPKTLGSDYKKTIRDMDICKSFLMLEAEIKSIHYYVVQYFHFGDWWCDVYTGDSYNHKDADLCDDILNDIALIDENLSADKPSDSDFSSLWTGCDGLKPVHACDLRPNFSVKAIPMCASTQVKYYLVTYYYGYSLGTYKVPDMPGLESISELCKVFRFKIDKNKHERVSVQYFKDGEWRCQLFERAVDDGVVRFKKQMWWGPCLRFTTEGKKKPVNGVLFPAGSKFHKAGLII